VTSNDSDVLTYVALVSGMTNQPELAATTPSTAAGSGDARTVLTAALWRRPLTYLMTFASN